VISANIKTKSSALSGATIQPYALFERHFLAVIGITTPETPRISSPSPQTSFGPPSSTLAEQIRAIKAAHPSIKRFVALTHIGYNEDIELARHSTDVSVIIGGHSHTLLGDMDHAWGRYPTVVKNLDGKDVLVATSFKFGEYLGRLTVTFGADGSVTKWDGHPIRMTKDIKQDRTLARRVSEWRQPFERFGEEVVGHVASVSLSNTCHNRECSLGNLVCDVMVAFRRSGGETAQVDLGLFNAGGIRTPLPKGEVTRAMVMDAFPFGNAVVEMDLTGQELWDVFSCESLLRVDNQRSG
jgi:2',3'-cyclic-nucleotide 2'-phosphodiesterase (5'-nucleotidase family)